MRVFSSPAPAPEFRLFCQALRVASRDEGDEAALRAAISASADWHAILRGARRHRVVPQLLAALKRSAAIVPAPVIAELQQLVRAGAAQNLLQIAELRRLSGLFADAGIRVLMLKGVVLSVQIYGDPGSRSPGDIDLLVDPERADDADALLVEAGYARRGRPLSPWQRVAYRNRFREFTYDHPVCGELDVHHRLSDHPAFAPWSFDTLWGEREEVPVAGSRLPTLPRRCLPLYLCVHGAEHAWERLRWLLDLALLCREPGQIDPALAAAEGVGLAAAMLQALHLAHDRLGLDVPDPVLARAESDSQVARLGRILSHFDAAETWHQVPSRNPAAGLWRYSLWLRLYRYSLGPDWRYRLDCLKKELISMGDWQAWSLPDALFWIYPVIRPFGWLVRRFSR